MTPRPVECKCDHSFTCGFCLRNAKPWFWTCSDGSAIAVGPPQGTKRFGDSAAALSAESRAGLDGSATDPLLEP